LSEGTEEKVQGGVEIGEKGRREGWEARKKTQIARRVIDRL
jgi:hypothetical protein